jgi:proteic killer suppression protein
MFIMYVFKVLISSKAEKQLKKIPLHIKEALLVWAASVQDAGLYEVRKIKGYHDEPLKGDRAGQRSVRLNRAYRAIYTETSNGIIIELLVLEVNKHEY